jgi:hypothetical protein
MTPEEIKAAALGAKDRAPVPVKTPEWSAFGLPVCHLLLPLGGTELDRYDQIKAKKLWPENPDNEDWRGLRAAAVGLCQCDENGTLLNYTDAELLILGQKSGAVLDRLYQKIRSTSGMLPGAVEDEEKN